MTTICSFSGGRSSGMMLSMMDDCLPIFCNTGMEHPATLDFVRDCESIKPIIWLEYREKKTYEVVNYQTASRNGEPFAQLITDRNYLPNPVARFCTSELKVLTIQRYLKDQGIKDYEMAVGMRADEPRRVAKMRGKEDYILPLADNGITQQDVQEFWQRQSFNLSIPSTLSNCTLCFLKGYGIKQSMVNEQPQLADWWIEQERKIGATFRKDHATYADMKMIATDQQGFDFSDDESIACFCGE